MSLTVIVENMVGYHSGVEIERLPDIFRKKKNQTFVYFNPNTRVYYIERILDILIIL